MMPGGIWILESFRRPHCLISSLLLLVCLLRFPLFPFPPICPILLLFKSKYLASAILPFPLLLTLVLPLTSLIPLFFLNWPCHCLGFLYLLNLICLMASRRLMALLPILFPRTFYSLPIVFRSSICWSRCFILPLL